LYDPPQLEEFAMQEVPKKASMTDVFQIKVPRAVAFLIDERAAELMISRSSWIRLAIAEQLKART
jgi:Ribbon-helix-helix protein, copG family